MQAATNDRWLEGFTSARARERPGQWSVDRLSFLIGSRLHPTSWQRTALELLRGALHSLSYGLHSGPSVANNQLFTITAGCARPRRLAQLSVCQNISAKIACCSGDSDPARSMDCVTDG